MWGSSTTTLKTKICCQLERRFQYFRLEFGYKMEQIIFVIVTCLSWNAAVILLWAFSLFLYHSMMHYCLSGILERGEQQELSIQETCNIVFFFSNILNFAGVTFKQNQKNSTELDRQGEQLVSIFSYHTTGCRTLITGPDRQHHKEPWGGGPMQPGPGLMEGAEVWSVSDHKRGSIFPPNLHLLIVQ